MARRLAISALVGLVVLVSSLVGTGALAQDAGDTPEEHRLVGSWLILFPDDPGAAASLYTFGADGTIVGSSAAGPRHGTWEATGDRTAAFTVLGLVGGPQLPVVGLLRLRGTVEVDEAGSGFALTYSAETIAPDGTVSPASGPLTARGTRITAQTPTETGTPTQDGATPAAGGTPTADASPAGTPVVDEAIATALATALP